MFPITGYEQSAESIKYPFSTRAKLPSWFPLNFILDILIVKKNASIDITKYYLNALTKTDSSWTIAIQQIGGADLAQITVPVKKVTPVTAEKYFYSSDQIDIKIVIGKTDYPEILNGIWGFSSDETEFETSNIVEHAENEYLDNLSIKRELDGTFVQLDSSNRVIFKNGYNVSLVQITDFPNSISFEAIPGAGLGMPPCDPTEYKGIRYVNKQVVTKEYNASSGNCIEIKKYLNSNLIGINDKCEPCCKDCDIKLSEISDSIDILQSNIDLISARIAALEPE